MISLGLPCTRLEPQQVPTSESVQGIISTACDAALKTVMAAVNAISIAGLGVSLNCTQENSCGNKS